ncbi:MAG: SDR family oxidoreductase [Deltaproteobacteria bacterium]|nr:SDR family oxidoreductase [Deltaproteobacteria bacterium]MBW2360681.1 SDR family oxidoreductase [Deltaproteobacteria bacterium]
MSDRAARAYLVTGGADGFGRELALGLADAGLDVAVVGDSGREEEVKGELEELGVKSAAATTDFRTREATELAFREAVQSLGRLDGVLHARICPQALQPGAFHEIDDASFDTCCEAEIRAAIFTLQAARACFSQPHGRIVLVTPTLALSGAAGHAALSAAFEAQRAMAKSAARQWGRSNILVNCIAPALEAVLPQADAASEASAAGGGQSLDGASLGGRGDMRRDIAPFIALLARDGAHFVTGQTICLDGGVWLAS